MRSLHGSQTRRRVVAVVGQTATGKTPMGVACAQWLESEVVSADSQLVYKSLNIGTAKPNQAEMAGVPHWMIDVCPPNEVFSAASYQHQAQAHLERLWNQGRVPVVVGGTGFYLRALLESDLLPDVPPNPVFRAEMQALADQHGSGFLHARLQEQDSARAAALHPNDRVRVIRALEIIEATGQPVPTAAPERPVDVLWLGLTAMDRDGLRRRIDERIDQMLSAGWLEEVAGLVAAYGPQAHALQVAHGYPELVDVVLGHRALADAVEQIRINIHQYARRQMTWFRRNPRIHWYERDQQPWETLLSIVRNDLHNGLGSQTDPPVTPQ